MGLTITAGDTIFWCGHGDPLLTLYLKLLSYLTACLIQGNVIKAKAVAVCSECFHLISHGLQPEIAASFVWDGNDSLHTYVTDNLGRSVPTTILKRTTNEIHTSVNTFEYDLQEWLINPNLSNVTETDPKFWKIEPDDTVSVMDAAGQTQVEEERLTAARSERLRDVDARTATLIESGFEFPPTTGKRFSLSVDSRTVILGLIIAKDMIPYPLRYNTTDQLDYFDLQGPDDVLAFYGTALGTFKAVEDAATTIKNALRSAQTKTELDQVVDPR
jgi:hypothetical protein